LEGQIPNGHVTISIREFDRMLYTTNKKNTKDNRQMNFDQYLEYREGVFRKEKRDMNTIQEGKGFVV
jgi:hypothetical protein